MATDLKRQIIKLKLKCPIQDKQYHTMQTEVYGTQRITRYRGLTNKNRQVDAARWSRHIVVVSP